MKPQDLVGMEITAVVNEKGVIGLIGTTLAGGQKVYLTRDIWEADPLQSIVVLKKAFGYGRAPIAPTRAKRDNDATTDAAPFVPTTVAEDDVAQPAAMFDMGPKHRLFNSIQGVARPADPEKVEGWEDQS